VKQASPKKKEKQVLYGSSSMKYLNSQTSRNRKYSGGLQEL
jgi:hypothetical protein